MAPNELKPGVVYQCEDGRRLITRELIERDGEDVVYLQSDRDMKEKHSAEWFAAHVLGVVEVQGAWGR